MARWDNRNVAKSSVALEMMYIAKLIFPLITLPYLTRVLSTECYGAVTYVRAVMVYMEALVDFGFVLSATKHIVNAGEDHVRLGVITGNTIVAKLLLSGVAFAILMVLTLGLPLLREHLLFTILSFSAVPMSAFLLDFVFRGLARMQVITIRFVIMRGIATALIFFLVRRDSDLLLLPIVELVGLLFAIAFVALEIRKFRLSIAVTSIRDILASIRESSVYFTSNIADTSFNGLSTVFLGILLSSSEVARWGVCLQLIGAVQAFYAPIMESAYPAMVQRKDSKLIVKLLKLFLPAIAIGCCLAYAVAPWGLVLVGGRQYASAAGVYRRLIPVLLLSFPSLLFGWPTLGAIGQQAKICRSSVIAAAAQAIGLAVLAISGTFTLFTVALLRSATEMLLLALRSGYSWRYRSAFQTT